MRAALAVGIGCVTALVIASASSCSAPIDFSPIVLNGPDRAAPPVYAGFEAATWDRSEVGPRPTDAPAIPKDGGIALAGEWVPVGSLPPACQFQASRKPELIPRFPWRACANRVVGCESFVADWADVGAIRPFSPVRLEPVYEDGTGIHVTYERDVKFADLYSYKVVQNMSGVGEAAFAIAHGSCGLILQASQHGLAAAFVVSPQNEAHLGWGQVARGTELTTTLATITPSLYAYQGVAHGDGFLTIEATSFGGPIVGAAYRLTDRTFVGPTANHTLPNELPRPVSGGFVSLLDSTPPTIAFVPLTGGQQVLARPSPGMTMSALAIDRKQNTLVWGEASPADEQTLWTSPMATTEAGMQPRKVAKLFFESAVVANAGVAVVVDGAAKARIVRLSDGLGWDVPAEPGLTYQSGLWVNDDSVWLLASKVVSGGSSLNSAVRFSRASLGNPTVPSGL